MQSFMDISEFINCKNPLTGRVAFYLTHTIRDVGEEWGCDIQSRPCSTEIENGCSIITAWDNKTSIYHNFMMYDSGEVVKVKISSRKTGNKIYNDDIQILDEFEELYELGDSIGVVDDIVKLAESLDGIETIACQVINLIDEWKVGSEYIRLKLGKGTFMYNLPIL